MYEDRYGFREKPFSLTPNPKFFFSNGAFQHAYEGLLAGVRDRKGILLLTGEAGCGKTMLLRKLRENLDPSDRIVAFHFTNLAPPDFLSFVCENLGVESKAMDIDGQLKDVAEFLAGLRRAGRSAALLIDEAENLREEVLQMLPALAGGDGNGDAALQIVLVGRPQLETALARAEMTELRHRITAQYRLERLTEDEIAAFIKHRLSVVGYTRESPFTSYAVVLIARLSGGIPRLVNVICDRAFQIAADSDSRRVSTSMIQQVSQELGLGREDDPTTEAILAAERSLPPRIERAEHAPEPTSEPEPAATPKAEPSALPTPPLAERAAAANLPSPGPVPSPSASPERPEAPEPSKPRDAGEPRLDVDRGRRKAPELGATRRRPAAVDSAPPPRRLRWAAVAAVLLLSVVSVAYLLRPAPLEPALAAGEASWGELRIAGSHVGRAAMALVGVDVGRPAGSSGGTDVMDLVTASGPADNTEVDSLKTELESAAMANVRLQSDLAALTEDRDKLAKRLESIAEAQDEADQQTAKIDAALATAATDRAELENTIDQLRGERDLLSGRARGLEQQQEELRSQLQIARQANETNRREIEDRLVELAMLKIERDQLRRKLEAAENAAGQNLGAATTGASPAGVTSRLSRSAADKAVTANRLAALMLLARRQVDERKLILPAGDNAVETYKEVLSLAPTHTGALAGIRDIKAHYRRRAEQARSSGQLSIAGSYYKTILQIDPADAEVREAMLLLNQPGATNQQ